MGLIVFLPGIACVQTSPSLRKNRERRRLWITVVNHLPVYICINYFLFLRWQLKRHNGIQIPFTFFVFALHWKTDLNFAFCFSVSLNFEKRIWTSYFFFVFASLWKTDMNFSFRSSFSHHFEERIWISFFVFALLVIEKQIGVWFVNFAWIWKVD